MVLNARSCITGWGVRPPVCAPAHARSLRRRAFAQAGQHCDAVHRASLSRSRAGSEAFEQGLGADQVRRAEAFREPIINGLQQCQGFIAAALALPETHEIARRAELPGEGLLAPCGFQTL